MTTPSDNFPVTMYASPSDDGWWTCTVVSPDRGILVLTPEVETEEGAKQMARDMYALRSLVVPATAHAAGHA